jgi:hypothetical protein
MRMDTASITVTTPSGGWLKVLMMVMCSFFNVSSACAPSHDKWAARQGLRSHLDGGLQRRKREVEVLLAIVLECLHLGSLRLAQGLLLQQAVSVAMHARVQLRPARANLGANGGHLLGFDLVLLKHDHQLLRLLDGGDQLRL